MAENKLFSMYTIKNRTLTEVKSWHQELEYCDDRPDIFWLNKYGRLLDF